jgi:hypothetical protein
MADLREEVAVRLRKTLHGREIDTIESSMPELPHMLGVVTIGAISTEEAESGSILDPNHKFWEDYHEPVKTKGKAKRKIESAVQSLKNDGAFRLTEPYGEDAGIWYCEMDDIVDNDGPFTTTCEDCGESIKTELEISRGPSGYCLEFLLVCESCSFSNLYRANAVRQ